MAGTEVGGGDDWVAGDDKLTQKLKRLFNDPQFQSEPSIQSAATWELQKVYSGLTATAQDGLLQTFAPRFPRVAEEDNPTECLREILHLSRGDMRRALDVRQAMYQNWRPGPDEDIYPNVGWIGDLLSFCKHNKVATAYYFWAAISLLGACCRRNFVFPGKDRDIQLNNYILLTGPKGAGKSDALEMVLDLLRRVDEQLEALKTVHSIINCETFQVHVLGSDQTAPALVQEMHQHCQVKRLMFDEDNIRLPAQDGESVTLLAIDELSSFLGRDTHGAGLKIPFLVELAFKDNYSKGTKKQGMENVAQAALSMLACTQPSWMHNTVVGDAMMGGFLERLIIVHRDNDTTSARERWRPRLEMTTLDPLRANRLAEWLIHLLVRSESQVPMRIEDDARITLSDWERSVHQKGSRDAVDSSKHSLDRFSLHVPRVASLLAISEWDFQGVCPWIQESHIRQAVLFLETEDPYREQFITEAQESDDEPMMRMMMDFIRSKGGEVPKSVFNQHGRFKRMDHQRREYMVAGLVARGDLRIEKRLSKNKKMVEWYVIPEGR